MSGACARGGPLDLGPHIWALQRSIVQRRPAFRLRQKLLSLQPALVEGIGDDSPSCGHIYTVAVAVPRSDVKIVEGRHFHNRAPQSVESWDQDAARLQQTAPGVDDRRQVVLKQRKDAA